MREIQGLKFVLVGAAGGMGKAISKMLSQSGVELILADRNYEDVASLGRELGMPFFQVDATDESSVGTFMAQVGPCDGLINLAGISIPAKIAEMSVEDYEKTMDINVKTVFLTSKYYLQNAKSGGLLLHIGSMAARRPNGNAPLYCAAKAAVNTLSEGIALQAKEKGVRLTTLNPGGANTAFWGDRAVPREKMLNPEDIGEVIRFILSLEERIAVHHMDFESFLML